MKKILIIVAFLIFVKVTFSQNSLTNNDISFKEVSYNSSFMMEERHTLNLSLTSSLSSNIQETGRIHFHSFGIWHELGLAVGTKLNSRFKDFYKTTSAEVLLAKQIRLAKQHNLNLGLNFGILYNGMDLSQLNNLVDFGDPTLSQQEDQIAFQGGFGLSYVWNEKLKIGASMPELAKSGSEFYPTIFANASYKQWFGDEKFYLEPAALAYFTTLAPATVEGSAKFGFKDYAWLKIGGRSTKSLVIAAGAGYDFVHVGYAYNMNFGTYENINQMQHNINVTFKLIDKKDIERKKSDRNSKKKEEKDKKKKKEKEAKEKKLREAQEKKEKEIQEAKEKKHQLEKDIKDKELAVIRAKNDQLEKELKEKEAVVKKEKEEALDKNENDSKGKNFKDNVFKESEEIIFMTTKLTGYTLANYYISIESFKNRTNAKAKQSEMEKMGQKPFIMRDVKTGIFYLCIGSDNSKTTVVEKYNVLKETIAPNAWIIINK